MLSESFGRLIPATTPFNQQKIIPRSIGLPKAFQPHSEVQFNA
jgi:hypothetical protein